jgi:uncharacterized membrane protein
MHDPAVARRQEEQAAVQANANKIQRDHLSTFLMSCMIGVFVLVAGIGWLATRDYVWLLYGSVVFLAGAFISSGIAHYHYPRPKRSRK